MLLPLEGVIDLHLLRADPSEVTRALARRGVDANLIEDIVELDVVHRSLLQRQETLRAEVKAISKEVGAAKKAGDETAAAALAEQSRRLGAEEREAAHEAELAGVALRNELLVLPNIPSSETPDGLGEADNVECSRWWPGSESGAPEPRYEEFQRVPHWEIGEQLGLLDLERAAKLSG